ncbi:MAG: rRNA maturation RNase YbeY [Candidatus Riflebacteria bacterium]|nr:rRNA maturation RNase YbeY [Candidatus Riflebacteria bacterium]
MEVLINNRQKKIKINTRRIRTIAQEIMKFEGLPDHVELSVVFCDDDFVQKLNNQYLGHNRPTDVLSFPIEEEEFESEIRMIGDVVISVEAACRQAEELKHPVELEIVFLLTHGLLHLIGYDHSVKSALARMKQREETICSLLSEKKLLKDLETHKTAAPLIKRAVTPSDAQNDSDDKGTGRTEN